MLRLAPCDDARVLRRAGGRHRDATADRSRHDFDRGSDAHARATRHADAGPGQSSEMPRITAAGGRRGDDGSGLVHRRRLLREPRDGAMHAARQPGARAAREGWIAAGPAHGHGQRRPAPVWVVVPVTEFQPNAAGLVGFGATVPLSGPTTATTCWPTASASRSPRPAACSTARSWTSRDGRSRPIGKARCDDASGPSTLTVFPFQEPVR